MNDDNSIIAVNASTELTMVNSPARDTTISENQVTKKLSNVLYQKLQSICHAVLETSICQSNELKNAVLTHLQK